MQISESQVRDYSSLHLKWMLLNKNNKINKKQIVQFFSPLFPSYILFSFCEKINESQIFPAFFTYKWFQVQFDYLLYKFFSWFE